MLLSLRIVTKTYWLRDPIWTVVRIALLAASEYHFSKNYECSGMPWYLEKADNVLCQFLYL